VYKILAGNPIGWKLPGRPRYRWKNYMKSVKAGPTLIFKRTWVNPEIRNSLKVDNIVEDIKQYQRRWVDHQERMDRSRLPRLAFQYQPRGWRDRGRPRARWKDQEHLELQRNRS
jgi:hypothetical protein